MLRHLKCVFRNNRMKLQNRHIATAPPMWQTVNSYLVRIRYFARSRDFLEIRDSRAVSPIPFDSKSHLFPTKSPKKDHTNEAKRKETGKGGSQSVTFCHSFSVGRITSNREKNMSRTYIPTLISSETPANGSTSATQHADKKKCFFSPTKNHSAEIDAPFSLTEHKSSHRTANICI